MRKKHEYDAVQVKNDYENATSPEEQIKLIRYAGTFSKKKTSANGEEKANKDAQLLIVEAAQGHYALSNEVGQVAKEEFYKFFCNYVKSECGKSLRNQLDLKNNAEEKTDMIEEASNHCFTYIFENFNRYDPERAALSTFFINYIKDALDDFQAQDRSYSSKTRLQIDRKIRREINDLIENRKPLELYKIAQKTGCSVDQVKISMERLEAQNTMTHLDAEEVQKAYSEDYKQPEKNYLSKELSEEICEAADLLSELEKQALFLTKGVQQLDHEIVYAKELSIADTAKRLGISEKDVHRYYVSAVKKLRNKLNENKDNVARDEHIIGRHAVTFSKSKEDEEVANIVGAIVEIIDD